MTFFDYIKNIFFILIILQITPMLLKGIKRQYSGLFESRTHIAVLPIRGILYDSSYYVKQLGQFFADQDIKGILLKIECPGSASGSSEIIYKEILSLKSQYPKPVIVLIENICASGGYWIACAGDYIIAPGSSLIGSIGATFPYLFQLKSFIEHYNISYKNLASGAYKSATNPFVDLTPDEEQLLQGVLDDTYQQFTQVVAKSRKLSLNNTSQWANGKIFTGQQAHKFHLIDEIGGPQQTIAALKRKALIEGKIEWVHPPTKAGWFASLFGLTNPDDSNSMFSGILDAICTHLETRYHKARLA